MGQMQASQACCPYSALWGFPVIAVAAAALTDAVAGCFISLCGCLHWSVAGAPTAMPSSGTIMQWGKCRQAWGSKLSRSVPNATATEAMAAWLLAHVVTCDHQGVTSPRFVCRRLAVRLSHKHLLSSLLQSAPGDVTPMVRFATMGFYERARGSQSIARVLEQLRENLK